MSGGHWTPGLVELAGGEPILADPGANSRVLDWHAIAAAQPEVAIVAPCGFDLPRTDAAVTALAPAARRALGPRVRTIDGNAYVNRPGPRLVDTAELFAAAIAG
jgi:iron complex transport system substrate-binding protein